MILKGSKILTELFVLHSDIILVTLWEYDKLLPFFSCHLYEICPPISEVFFAQQCGMKLFGADA